jgi:hypothetical protein
VRFVVFFGLPNITCELPGQSNCSDGVEAAAPELSRVVRRRPHAMAAEHLLPESGPCLVVQNVQRERAGVLLGSDLVGGIAGIFGPGSPAAGTPFSECVLSRARLLELLCQAAGDVELTLVRNGHVVTIVLPACADADGGNRLGITFAKENLSLDWSDVREHWLSESPREQRPPGAPAASAPRRGKPASAPSSSACEPASMVVRPPPGAPAGGSWVRVRPWWRCGVGSARSEYRKGPRAWDEHGRLLRKPPPRRGKTAGGSATVVSSPVLLSPSDDGMVAFDPRLVVAPSGEKRLEKAWADEERRREEEANPEALREAFLDAGLPQALLKQTVQKV